MLFCVYQASTISNKEITAPFSTMIAAKDEDFAIDKMREYDAIQDLRLNLDFRVFESLKEGEKFSVLIRISKQFSVTLFAI